MSNIDKRIKFFQRKIDKGIGLDLPDRDGWTYLESSFYIALARPHPKLEDARALLLLGVDPDPIKFNPERLQSRHSPLMMAARKGYYALCELLLKKGANVNFMTSCGNTPLLLASHHNHARTCMLLLDNGADPNQSLTFFGNNVDEMVAWPPLLWALYHHQEDLVNHLIKHNAKVTEQIRSKALEIISWQINGCEALSSAVNKAADNASS